MSLVSEHRICPHFSHIHLRRPCQWRCSVFVLVITWVSTLDFILSLNENHIPYSSPGVRDALPNFLIHARRYLEALNFVFNWMECTDGSWPLRGGGIITARIKNDYDFALSGKDAAKVKKNIARTWCSEHMYAGAKAAFELFGNCELARAFLRKAAESNPHIITRILSKHPQPGEWTRHAVCFSPNVYDGCIFKTTDAICLGSK
jgi:hypothetical protein